MSRRDRLPRILVLSASVGAGHVRAAEAVELALRAPGPAATVHNVDVLTLTNPLFRRLYAKTYLDMVTKAPNLAGLVYDLTDQAPSITKRGDRLRILVERLNLGELMKLLRKGPDGTDDWAATGGWDLVVNAHFLPAEMISRLRRKRELGHWGKNLRQVTVVTDFDAHGLWVNDPTDHYFCATEEAAISLGRWGVERSAITVTGIPIHPVFAAPKDAGACRSKHGLSPDRPVVLLLAGGFGVGPVEELYQAALRVATPVHVVVVSGKNAKLKARLEGIAVPRKHRATVLGFTREMDELMAAASVVVSKPGGLTTSEVLARAAAMAIVNPIPGQESRNSDHLLEHGAAIKAASPALLTYKLDRLLQDPSRLAQLRKNAAALGRPRAAFDIAERVLRYASEVCAGR